MAKRTIIKIDDEKCIGCAKCVNACPGGALEMVDGKAKMVRDNMCDGIGKCIGKCPVDAIEFIEVEAAAAATQPAHNHQQSGGCPSAQNVQLNRPPASGCPSMQNKSFDRTSSPSAGNSTAKVESELNAWPIQLHLVRPEAPQFQGADILIAASCSAFSFGNFHQDYLSGRGLVIACPKLDVQDGYLEKLTRIFAESKPNSVTILRMEVPCCSGLTGIVTQARNNSGNLLPIKEDIISVDGQVKRSTTV